MSKRTCTIPGCEKAHTARGLCSSHYAKARQRGDFTDAVCSVDGCTRGVYGKGLCNPHWQSAWRRDPDRGALTRPQAICSVSACDRPVKAQALCLGHYTRLLRHGDPGATPIKDVGAAGSGWLDGAGYLRIQINGRVHLMHRLIMAHALGRELLPTETVHHINGDRQDNRLENLQLRHGRHGKGYVVRCCDCGSLNVQATPL